MRTTAVLLTALVLVSSLRGQGVTTFTHTVTPESTATSSSGDRSVISEFDSFSGFEPAEYLLQNRRTLPGAADGPNLNAPYSTSFDSLAENFGVRTPTVTPIPQGLHLNVLTRGTDVDWSNHQASPANAFGANGTIIDSPFLNGNPLAIPIVGRGGTADEGPVSLSYNSNLERWIILSEDLNPITNNRNFNVVTNTSVLTDFVHTTTGTNIVEDRTLLDHPQLNCNPHAHIFVTRNFDIAGTYYNEHVGVTYDADAERWAIYNENGGEMGGGTGFHVLIGLHPGTWRPTGWHFMDWPYLWDPVESKWRYFSEAASNTSWHSNLSAGTWSQMNSTDGWLFFADDFKYFYEWDDSDWHFYSKNNTQWIYDFDLLFWRVFRESPFSSGF